jgi:hypothetical protein
MASTKIPCNVCGKLLLPKSMKRHQQTQKCQASKAKVAPTDMSVMTKLQLLPEELIYKTLLYCISHPIVDMLDEYNDLFDWVLNYRCDLTGRTDCDDKKLQFVSQAVLLYKLKYYNRDGNHKLQTTIETKVIMNQIKNKIPTNVSGTQSQRFIYLSNKLGELKEQHPVFFHCNKEIVLICFVMLIRNIKVDLNKYDDLYEQFYERL